MGLLSPLRRLRQQVRTGWHNWKFRRNGVVGPLPKLLEKFPLLHARGELRFGERCHVWSADRDRTVFYIPSGGRILIGNAVYVNQGAVMCAEPSHSIVIEDHVLVGNNAWLATSNYHQVTPDKPVKAGSIHLKRNCWICQGALILPGVTVGEHAVVAARSVVTRDVPPRSIVAGSPAKVVSTFQCPDDWVRH